MKFFIYFFSFLIFTNSFAQKTLFEQGLDAFQKGNYDQAVSFYTLQLKKTKRPNFYFNRASANFELQKYEEAIEDLTIVIDKEQNDTEAIYKRASAYFHLGHFQKTIIETKKLLRLDSKDDKAFNLQGLSFFELKKYGNAIENFTNAINIKEIAQYIFNRATAYNKLDLTKKAETDFDKAIETNSNNTFVIGRGKYFYNKQQYDLAINDFSKAISVDSLNSTNIFNRALAYYSSAQYNKAIKDFEKVVEIQDNDIEAKWFLAKSNYQNKNYEETLKYYLSVESQDKNFPRLQELDKNELTNKIALGNYFWYIVILLILLLLMFYFLRKLFH